MRITVCTVCPEFFDSFLSSTMVRRAMDAGAVDIIICDIKEYADGCFRKIDDSPYGGGAGCVMRCEPVVGAIEAVKAPESHVALFAPIGQMYSQADARRFARMQDLVLVCGHYEGFDARIYPYADEIISVGDYILSGGEIAAMAVMDSVIRLFPESLKEESTREESFENGLLEYPQYTRPAEFRGERVPEVLLSGNHEAIRRWRQEESVKLTEKLRPDLLEKRKED